MSTIEIRNKIHHKLYNFCDGLKIKSCENENNFRFLVQTHSLREKNIIHVWRERTHNSDFIITFRSLSNVEKSPVAIHVQHSMWYFFSLFNAIFVIHFLNRLFISRLNEMVLMHRNLFFHCVWSPRNFNLKITSKLANFSFVFPTLHRIG